jgi:ligand-binding sensor domain-containing protein
MKNKLLLLICLIPLFQIFAQQTSSWRNYTNMQTVNDAFVTSDGIWAATNGGAYFYNFKNNSYQLFTKAEGLGNNELTAIAKDNEGKIWFGSNNGIIDVYDINTNNFVKRILDIFNSSKTVKQINNIQVIGDTIYISTAFGLSLIDAKTFYFHDTFIKFGNLSSDIKIRSIYKDSLLYVASENGIAKQKVGAVNLSAPESWENYYLYDGLPSNSIYKFVKFQNTLIVTTDRGLALFNNTKWQLFLPQFSNSSISDIQVRNDSLFILSNNNIFIYANGKVTQPFANLASAVGISLSDNRIFSFGSNGALEVKESGNSNYLVPNGPSSNIFYGIAVDKNSNLWGGSGSSGLATGFYKFDGTRWTNYTKDDVPNGNYNQVLRPYVDPNNTIYLMTWGDGFIRYKNNKFQIFNSHNTNLNGIPTDINYVIVQGLANDTKGNLWILTYLSSNKQPLAVLKTDSTWQFYSDVLTSRVLKGYALTIDENDTKWMIMGSDASSGGESIYYFNENKSLYSTDINGWGMLSTSNGLNTDAINALAIDRAGELWIGTSEGLNVITDTRFPRNISSPNLLRSQVVNAIAVDALNQKWIGTQQGVFLISTDGTSILANYNSTNSPLPNDAIRSIAVDNNTGIVYFGTDYGLASLTTPAIYPQEGFTDITVYPNPLKISGNNSAELTIDGLIRDTDIKILSITGKMITTFSSPGGRKAYWDGKDINGAPVNTGIYLIIAYDKEGNSVGIGKVAVIKE